MSPPLPCAVGLLLLLAASSVFAQPPERESFAPEVVRKVILDPTTYAPAIVGWGSTRLDWQSSQVFFQNGWSEHNPRFTMTGRADDTAIGYGAGNRQILTDAIAILQLSVVHNLSSRVTEHLLIPRFPNHRRLIRAIGWIERSVVATYWAHRISAGHFRQWQENKESARHLGYR